eukprot:c11041_g1_i2.p1 GENE.c11041_g1_i2~~c11041_g1_i2.p1  ORF type:complete len:164 (-),score=44.43 c11041_g1_i2:75-566(-)
MMTPEQSKSNPSLKTSHWVIQRQQIEALKPPGFNEVVMADHNGHILEGTQSNFFVVHRGRIVTAGSGILDGTVRRIVLSVCTKHHVPVELECPCVNDLDSWDGAFLTSTSRLLLPIDQITFQQHTSGEPRDVVRMFDKSHPMLLKLGDLVGRAILEESEQILV